MNPAPGSRGQRLALAFEAGLDLTGGPVGLWHPEPADPAPPVDPARLTVITPHAQAHAAWAARGLRTVVDDPAPGSLAASVVCLPRARAEALDLIARAARATAGPVVVDGQKAEGVEPVLRALAGRVALSDPVVKAHGRLAWFAAVPLDDWLAGPQLLSDDDGATLTTRAGLFSADGIDPGSRLLAAALPGGMTGTAVDLGAGWGFLARRMLVASPGLTAAHLIESDARALACAQSNVTDPRARFHWADATRPIPGLAADHVVANPPFHAGRSADPSLGAAFIAAAAALLRPAGTLWLVANRHLPYAAPLAERFAEIDEIGGDSRYRLIRAARPRRAEPARRPLPPRRAGARR